MLTFARGLNSWQGARSAFDIALQHFNWLRVAQPAGAAKR
jgi:hypothetical protein